MEAAGGVGAGALAAAAEADTEKVFKKPLVAVGRVKKRTRRQVVLDEDEYTRHLERIIQRDFFPDLPTDNLNDHTKDAAASPATFETPARDSLEKAKETRDPFWDKVDKAGAANLGLDHFLSKHTSEDNASFTEILQVAEDRRKQKHAWMYGAEEVHQKERALQMALPSIDQQAKGLEKPLNVDGWHYKSQNYIMYIPDGVERTASEVVEDAARRRQVVAANTRLSKNPFDDVASHAHIASLAATRATDGRVGADGLNVTAPSPKVKGFSLVRTPSPAPGRGGETPVMTWGEVEGTPSRLDTPSFRMAATPRREQLALRLADEAGQRHRDRKLKAINAARAHLAPSASTPLLSPAARRLVASRAGDVALRASYTPGAASTPRTPLVRTPRTPLVRTPRTPASSGAAAANTTSGLPSDDLLRLPLRSRAETFFVADK